MVAGAVAEAVEAEERGVQVRFDRGAIGRICAVGDSWPLTEAAVVAQRVIVSLRDPAAVPLLVALVTGARRMPYDCGRCLPYWGVKALTAIPGERSVAALLEVLAESSGNTTDLRVGAAEALGDLGAVDGLRPVLREIGAEGEQRWLKVKVAAALAKRGDASGRAVAVDALGDEWALVRRCGVEAVTSLRPPDIIELLSPLLHDPDVRHSVICSLAEVGTPQAIEALVSLTDDPDADVAELCGMEVARLGALQHDDDLPDRTWTAERG